MEPDEQQERPIVQTIAEILAAGLAADVALRLIRKALAPLRVGTRAVRVAWRVLSREWFSPPAGEGPAGERALRDAWRYRAWFLLASARRLQAGLAKGEPVRDLIERELRYARQHTVMQRRRTEAARNADIAAELSVINVGQRVFVWWTRQDDRVSKDCAVLHGKIYPIDKPPDGIYPGAKHPYCRCRAVPVPAVLKARVMRRVAR